MSHRAQLGMVFGLGLVAVAAKAQMQTFHIEPAKSEVHFALPDKLHAVAGTFRVESGSFSFAPDGKISGKIAVDAASGKSGNDGRDRKMTEEELKAPNFATVTFSPRHYSGKLAQVGDSTIVVEGVFTLLGTPHDLVVPMMVHREGGRATAKGTFEVPYVKWGLKDPSKFVLRVGKEVKIDVILVGSIGGA